MNRHALAVMTAAILLAAGLSACADDASSTAADDGAGYKGSLGKADASAEAVFLRFEFDAELTTDTCWSTKDAIQDQLLYTIGQLNGDRSLGRLDHLDLSDVKTSSSGGRCTISYHARMPVAWGKKASVPTKYVLRLPRDVSYAGQQKFTEAYQHDCVEYGAHDVDSGSMWYYYRPALSGCKLAAGDIHEITATVSASPLQTTGKYPEYHKVWEDDRLEIVAVFGKFEDGKTSNDAGIDGYNRFVEAVRAELKGRSLETLPATLPANPGVANPDVELRGTLPDGRTVHVVALLVDNVRTAGASFDRRYEALSSSADLIIYNGHAGLGANIRALASKGAWKAGQYVIVFMNGCDTYAYIDSALAEAHADVNDDDQLGTKYVDLVANALPSFFRSMPAATMAMVRGLLAYDAPKTYEQIFGGIDSAEVVLVTGENDNVYVPGYGEHEDPPAEAWDGLAEGATVKRGEQRRYETPTLPAGRYRFTLSGSGDADLYVRAGEAPSLTLYDCRPYRAGSAEACEVELGSAAPIHVLVDGYAASSAYKLVGEVAP